MGLLLDISRTVARSRLPAPTGIDRVERAYIDWALDRDAVFLAGFDGRQHLLGASAVRDLIEWLDGSAPAPSRDLRAWLRPRRDPRLRRAQALVRRRASAAGDPAAVLSRHGGSVYLNVGHDNLSPGLMTALQRAGLPRLVMIHDTIPLDHPEFARRGTPATFRARLDAAVMAEGLLCNSADTASRVAHHISPPRIWVAPLGIDPAPGHADPGPAFLTIGTIEPRKNHALLLDVWEALGAICPAPCTLLAGGGGRTTPSSAVSTPIR